MLNPDVCFFHIEKCIGSSLRIILYNYFINIYNDDDIFLPSHKNNEQNLTNKEDLIYFKDKDYKIILCHCNYNHIDITNYFSNTCFSITCVRNPIDRIISHYYYFDYYKYKLKLHELDETNIKNIIDENGRTILMRLSGNTFNFDDVINNLKNINCIMIFEKFTDDIKLLNNLLNNKFNSNFIMENIHVNENNINYKEFKNQDVKIILKYIHLIEDMKIYSYIYKLNNDERFKL